MKLKLLTAAAALLAGGGAQAATPVNTVKQGIEISQKVENKEKKVVQSREIIPDGLGGLRFGHYDRGRSPKEYGEYLQRTGRQKWVKKY